jgi:nucleoid DNA-binding protein
MGERAVFGDVVWGHMSINKVRASIASKTGLKKKDVKAVFAELNAIAYKEVAKTEKFVIPGLIILKLENKPATKAHQKMMFGTDVFGMMIDVEAKPARKVVKIYPAKGLKDGVDKWSRVFDEKAEELAEELFG